jgi:DNA-binding XRE family transcriptional regulator
MTTKKAEKPHHNKKVAKNRGDKWKKSVATGKLYTAMNPTPLRQVRVKAGWSQQKLSDKLGLSLSTYGDIERGKRRMREPVMKKIVKLLNIRSSKIFALGSHNKYTASR